MGSTGWSPSGEDLGDPLWCYLLLEQTLQETSSLMLKTTPMALTRLPFELPCMTRLPRPPGKAVGLLTLLASFQEMVTDTP